MLKVRVSVTGKPSIPNHFLSMPRRVSPRQVERRMRIRGGTAHGALERTGRAPPADRGSERLAIAAAIFGISRVATEPSMAMLYSGLDATAAGEVVAELEAEGVAFEVDGAAIMVDTAARDRIRMQLAAKGLPAGGPAGYEILDGLSGFGTTSQMFDAAYWRAKEGELARTITGSPDVRSARVHLANPVSQPFSRTPAGSASVTVTMARGTLERGQAEAIRYLVSSAVAGITRRRWR